jgi:hypothetical protein
MISKQSELIKWLDQINEISKGISSNNRMERANSLKLRLENYLFLLNLVYEPGEKIIKNSKALSSMSTSTVIAITQKEEEEEFSNRCSIYNLLQLIQSDLNKTPNNYLSSLNIINDEQQSTVDLIKNLIDHQIVFISDKINHLHYSRFQIKQKMTKINSLFSDNQLPTQPIPSKKKQMIDLNFDEIFVSIDLNLLERIHHKYQHKLDYLNELSSKSHRYSMVEAKIKQKLNNVQTHFNDEFKSKPTITDQNHLKKLKDQLESCDLIYDLDLLEKMSKQFDADYDYLSINESDINIILNEIRKREEPTLSKTKNESNLSTTSLSLSLNFCGLQVHTLNYEKLKLSYNQLKDEINKFQSNYLFENKSDIDLKIKKAAHILDITIEHLEQQQQQQTELNQSIKDSSVLIEQQNNALQSLKCRLNKWETYVYDENRLVGIDFKSYENVVDKRLKFEKLLSMWRDEDKRENRNFLSNNTKLINTNLDYISFISNLRDRWLKLKLFIKEKLFYIEVTWTLVVDFEDQCKTFTAILNKTEQFYRNISINDNNNGKSNVLLELYNTIEQDTKAIKYLNSSFHSLTKYSQQFPSMSQRIQNFRRILSNLNKKWNQLNVEIEIKLKKVEQKLIFHLKMKTKNNDKT